MKGKIKEILEKNKQSEYCDYPDCIHHLEFSFVADEIYKLFDNSELVKDIEDRIKSQKDKYNRCMNHNMMFEAQIYRREYENLESYLIKLNSNK